MLKRSIESLIESLNDKSKGQRPGVRRVAKTEGEAKSPSEAQKGDKTAMKWAKIETGSKGPRNGSNPRKRTNPESKAKGTSAEKGNPSKRGRNPPQLEANGRRRE